MNEPSYLIELMKKLNTTYTLQNTCILAIRIFVGCKESKWSRLLCVDIISTWAALLTFNINNQFDGNPMAHKIFNTINTCSMRCILSFEFFHKPYNVLELIHCTEYLSAGSQKSHS